MQTPITIYRVQNSRGSGMFHAVTARLLQETEISFRHRNFNTPSEDNLNLDQDGKEWFCAYKSEGQLRNWVKPEEFDVLIDEGFNIFEFEVEEYQEGNHQIIFTKEGVLKETNITNKFM